MPELDVISLLQDLRNPYAEARPMLVTRSDGACLLYAGKLHWLFGVRDAGKSWIALSWAAQVIRAGQHVWWCTYEVGTSGREVVLRLRMLGVPAERLAGHLHVYEGELPDIDDVTGHPGGLLVLDPISPAITASGGSHADQAASLVVSNRLHEFMTAGAAVVVIDHVARSTSAIPDDPIGGVAKGNAAEVMFAIEKVHSPSPGGLGHTRLWVNRDKGARVLAVSPMVNGRHLAVDVRIASDGVDGPVTVTMGAPGQDDEAGAPGDDDVVAALRAYGPLSGTRLADRIGRRRADVVAVAAGLVEAGRVTQQGAGPTLCYALADDDPVVVSVPEPRRTDVTEAWRALEEDPEDAPRPHHCLLCGEPTDIRYGRCLGCIEDQVTGLGIRRSVEAGCVECGADARLWVLDLASGFEVPFCASHGQDVTGDTPAATKTKDGYTFDVLSSDERQAVGDMVRRAAAAGAGPGTAALVYVELGKTAVAVRGRVMVGADTLVWLGRGGRIPELTPADLDVGSPSSVGDDPALDRRAALVRLPYGLGSKCAPLVLVRANDQELRVTGYKP